MSKRVYEIARERSLGTKEVMDRLKDAGVEVTNHFAVVDDPVYDRVFGDGGSAQPEVPVAAEAPGGAGGTENGPQTAQPSVPHAQPRAAPRAGGRPGRPGRAGQPTPARGGARAARGPAAGAA